MGVFYLRIQKKRKSVQRLFQSLIANKLDKSKWIPIMILGTMLGVMIMLYFYKSTGAKAAWFDDSYTYRQRVPISNSGSILTNYQVSLILNTASLITAGKMQSDCDDIRIVSENGAVLPHWIEENNPGCNQTTTKIWTKVPSIPTTGTNIYLYYGNTNATNAQSGDNVFLFFDDFNDAALNAGKWYSAGTVSITGGAVRMAIGKIQSVQALDNTVTVESRSRVTSTTYTNTGHIAVGLMDSTQADGYGFWPFYRNNSQWHQYWRSPGVFTSLTSSSSWTTNTWYRHTVSRNSASFSWDVNGVNRFSGTHPNNGSIGSNTYLHAPRIWTEYPTGDGPMEIDWIAVREYASTEPTVGTFGSEEVSPGAVAYWKFDEGTANWAFDSARHGANGTLTNGPLWQSNDKCIQGTCLSFDGTDDYVNTNIDLSWSNTEAFTIALWVNAKNGGNRTIFGKGLGGSSNWEYSMRLAGANGLNPHFVYWNTTGQGTISLTSTQELTLNRWHHLTLTYDGAGTAYIYMDGNVTGSYSGTPDTLQNRANSLNIGGGYFNSGAAGYFSGLIDDVKVYSYARTAEEIKADYIIGAAASGSQAVLGAEDEIFLSDGLVGHWKMDESSWSGAGAVKDSSGNQLSGTAVGNATVAIGKFGNGGSLDGNGDYVSIGDHNELDITEALTLSAWIKTSDGTSAIMSKYNVDNYSYWLGFIVNELRFYVGGSTGGVSYSGITNPGILDNQWHHVVATYEPGKTKIYIDGKEQVIDDQVGTIPSSLYSGTANFLIGRDENNGNITSFNGSLDELRVYKRAFTPREVSQLYEWAPGPVGYWVMDAGTGSTAYDVSTNGNNGTITSALWSPGKYGNGLKFDGVSDYVAVADNPTIEPTSSFSIGAWIYLTAVQQNVAGIVAKDGNASGNLGNYCLCFSNSPSDILRFGFYDGANQNAITSPSATEQNMWVHAMGVFDDEANELRLYKNGVLVSTATSITGTPVTNNDPMYIGSRANNPSSYEFTGMIDDVRIYNYARTSKQVLQDMNAGHPSVGSPVGYWKLDEGYGSVINNTGNGGSTINGTIAGSSAPTWTNDGKFGKALIFDGTNDSVSLGSSAGLDLAADATLTAWIKPTKLSANNYIFASGDNAGGLQFAVELGRSANKLSTLWGTSGDGFDVLYSKSSLVSDEWQHVVVTRSGSGTSWVVKIYINGVLDSTQTGTKAVSSYVNSFLGNFWTTNTTQTFKGTMDEVKVYNYALTEDEIKTEYNQGKAIVLGSVSSGVGGTEPNNSAGREYCVPGDTATCNAPVGEWLMDQGVGTIAFDTSENNNVANFASGTAAPVWGKGIHGGSLEFDGNEDYVTMGDVLDMGTSDWTTSLWFKTADSDGNLISKSLAGSISGRWFTILQNNTVFSLMEGSVAVGISTPSAPYLDGGWHHVATTYDRDGDMSLYVDGMLKASDSISANSATNMQTNCHLLMGRYNATSDCTIPLIGTLKLDGSVDQVRIYNYVRTQAQIVWEYSRGAPIAHYKMDECEGTTIYNSAPTFNDSAAGKNGSLVLGATGVTTAGTCATSGAWANGATGKRGASMSFDGTNDYITIADPADGSLDFGSSQNFSIALWVKTTSSTPFYLVDKRNGTANTQPGYAILLSPTHLIVGIQDGTNKIQPSLGGPTINDGQWHHIVVVYNRGSSVIKGYLDGEKLPNEADISGTGNIDNTSEIRIGRSPSGNYAPGQLDDVRIYNYDLTDQQVKVLFNNGAVSFE